MANTFSQVNIHCVFAVKHRENFIAKNFRERLHGYMSGILTNDGAFPLAVGGFTDHVHVFFELPMDKSVSKLMQMLKATSSKWINENSFVQGKFSWQEGYSAFSYSRSQRNDVIHYIMNQEEHHKSISFCDEYNDMMKKFGIEFDPKRGFEFYD